MKDFITAILLTVIIVLIISNIASVVNTPQHQCDGHDTILVITDTCTGEIKMEDK